MNNHPMADTSAFSTSKMVLKLFLFVCIVTALNFSGQWLVEYLNYQVWPHNPFYMDRIIKILMVLFVVFMTLPFLPAIEIGLLLLAMVDVGGVITIYCLTLLSLSLAYIAGRNIPLAMLVKLLLFFHLVKAAAILNKMSEVERSQRLSELMAQLDSRRVQFWVKHHYLLIAVLLNLPGNSLIGGGGGIAMVCGMSGVLSYGRFLLTIALAALPVPVLVIAQKLMLLPV
ncbi:hypothetical protein [Hahella ganghwensis]|uniref:hypothetical protein n=1 Tax=Hahella ganghwensis TaxID=286420 RepID=UPI0014612F5D|nr:hypothetical protein [Hahella ganghwensis]